jgi:hypothetical protein
MTLENLPPLRIREADGSPNAIPVYEIVVSNGTLTDLGGGRVGLATGDAASIRSYASTGGSYLTFSLETDLTAERNLIAGMGISFADSGANNNLVIHPNTALLVTSGRTISAGSGLSGGGDLSVDRTLSVNTNVRDRVIGFFFAGSLSSLMLATSAMVYIPFNMEIRDVRLAVSHSAGGQNIMIQPTMWNGALQANTGLFAAANRPVIVTNSLVGSSNTLGFTVLHAGSFLGIQIDSVGTTVVASNLTVSFILRTS